MRLLRDVIRVRIVAIPIVSLFGLVIVLMDPAPWRVLVLAVMLPSILGLSVHERIHLRRRRADGWDWTVNMAATVIAQLMMALATGGLASPVVVASLIVAFASSAASSSSASGLRALLLALQIVAFFTFAWIQTTAALPLFIPRLFEGMAQVGPGTGPWVVAAFYALLAVMAMILGERVGFSVREAYVRRLDEREENLRLLREHAAEMNQLTAEIAHELKNPLASVKGLAAILHGSAQGKERERSDVLRREIARMQDVLDELLTLSRPLLPLHREPTSLGAASREVLELLSGQAEVRRVGLELEVRADLTVPCDGRKLRQVLVNLGQNALEAAPPGSSVTFTVEADDGWGVIQVSDRGPGLDPSLGERVFDRGVTTKEQGHGIGLGVARTLARQHGGDLALMERDGGGCRAQLRLPLATGREDAA